MQIILVVALPEDSDYVFGKLVDTQISISIFLRICKVLNFGFNDLSYIKQISSRESSKCYEIYIYTNWTVFISSLVLKGQLMLKGFFKKNDWQVIYDSLL